RLSKIPGIVRTSTSSILELIKRSYTIRLPDPPARRAPGRRRRRGARPYRGRRAVPLEAPGGSDFADPNRPAGHVGVGDVDLAGDAAPDVRPRDADREQHGDHREDDPRNGVRALHPDPSPRDEEPENRGQERHRDHDAHEAERAHGGAQVEDPADE